MRIDIRHNFEQVKRDLKRLQSDIRERAIARALNRTAEQARTQMVRGITQEFAVKAGEVREQVRLRKAREGSFGLQLTADIEAFGRRRGRRSRNVILFSARATGKLKGKRKGQPGGVTVRIKRGQGRKLIPGAFIGNKGRTVFKRVGPERLPIKAVETIDVPQMFNTRRINSRVVKHIEQTFPTVLRREVDYYVARFNK